MSTATLPPYNRIGRRDHEHNVPPGPDSNFCRGLQGRLVKSNLQNCVSISVCKDSKRVQFDQALLGDPNFCNAQMEGPSHSRREDEPLNEWAARQAREIITSIESQPFSSDAHRPMSKDAGCVLQESSASRSDASPEIPNMRASTLVQMWRELEAEAGLTSRRTNQACSTTSSISTRTSTGVISNSESLVEEPSGDFEVNDSADDRSTDWESDTGATPAETPTSLEVSDVGDREKGRVADVIKRFTSGTSKGSLPVFSDEIDSSEQSPRFENVYNALLDQCFNQSREVVGLNINGNANYRRIRGTQALKILLMRMEGERKQELARLGERHVVSQFPHRGRIQSLLRFRFLSREVTVQGRQNPPPTSLELNQLQSGTSVLLLRQKFSSRGQPTSGSTLTPESNSSTEQDVHMENQEKFSHNTHDPNNLSDSKQEEPIRALKIEPQLPCSLPSTRQEIKEEARPSTGGEWRGKSSCIGFTNCQSNASNAHNILVSDNSCGTKQLVSETWKQEGPERASEEAPKLSCKLLSATGELKDEAWKQVEPVRASEKAPQLSCRLPSTPGEGKEEASPIYKAKQSEKGSCIDHPNSKEQLFRESYQELEPIRTEDLEPQVSCSLPYITQDLREGASPSSDAECRGSSLCIDHLNWHENANTSPNIQSSDGDAVEEELDTGQIEEHGHDTSLIYRPRQMQEQEFRRQAMYDDWLERISDNVELRELYERRSVSTALASDFRVRMDQLILSVLGRRGQEPTEETMTEGDEDHLIQNYEVNNGDLVPSESEQLPLPHVRYLHDQGNSLEQSPFEYQLPNQSLEMELIFELRGDMVRIHEEVSDLKRSIRSCMDMQLELQRYIKQGVAPDTYQAESLLNSKQQLNRRGNCCICYEMQVDSLLYRCGHMCACFKCAYELQWSSGRCPICRASIVDVVRAYSDS